MAFLSQVRLLSTVLIIPVPHISLFAGILLVTNGTLEIKRNHLRPLKKRDRHVAYAVVIGLQQLGSYAALVADFHSENVGRDPMGYLFPGSAGIAGFMDHLDQPPVPIALFRLAVLMGQGARLHRCKSKSRVVERSGQRFEYLKRNRAHSVPTMRDVHSTR